MGKYPDLKLLLDIIINDNGLTKDEVYAAILGEFTDHILQKINDVCSTLTCEEVEIIAYNEDEEGEKFLLSLQRDGSLFLAVLLDFIEKKFF